MPGRTSGSACLDAKSGHLSAADSIYRCMGIKSHKMRSVIHKSIAISLVMVVLVLPFSRSTTASFLSEMALEHRDRSVVLRSGCVGAWQFDNIPALEGLDLAITHVPSARAAIEIRWNATATTLNSSTILAALSARAPGDATVALPANSTTARISAPCRSQGTAAAAHYRVILEALAYTFPHSVGPVGGLLFSAQNTPPASLGLQLHGDVREKDETEKAGRALAVRAARGWWYRSAQCSVPSATTTQRNGAMLSVTTVFDTTALPCSAGDLCPASSTHNHSTTCPSSGICAPCDERLQTRCPGLAVGPDAHVCLDDSCYAVEGGPFCLPERACLDGKVVHGAGGQCVSCPTGLFRAGEAHRDCVERPTAVEWVWMTEVMARGARFIVRGARAQGLHTWRLRVALRQGDAPADVAVEWQRRVHLPWTVLRAAYALTELEGGVSMHDTTHAWVWAVRIDEATRQIFIDNLELSLPALPMRLPSILVAVAQTILAILLAFIVFFHNPSTRGRQSYVPVPKSPAQHVYLPVEYTDIARPVHPQAGPTAPVEYPQKGRAFAEYLQTGRQGGAARRPESLVF